jgi:hypothetical protein
LYDLFRGLKGSFGAVALMPAARFTDLDGGAASAAARFASTEGDVMFDVTNSSPSTEAVDLLACEVLADLYRAYCGAAPVAVRAYRDDDALLLLLRFDPEAPSEHGSVGDRRLPTAVALQAMPGMVASAVEARTGVRLAPGNLSMCSARGLAVFAFSALGDDCEARIDDDPFRLDAALAPARPALRLAS